MFQVAEPSAYYFAGPLRQPEIVIVANTELEAKAEFRRIAGRVVPPRRMCPVIIASPDIQELMEVELSGNTPRTEYEAVDEQEFPLLSYFGGGKITPEWVIDPRNRNVCLAGEYASIPESLLEVKHKPSVDEVLRAGGRTKGMEWDLQVAILQEELPWLRLEDGESLRQMLLEECSRWERRYEQ